MPRPRRHIYWYVTAAMTPDGRWWWVPSLHAWHRADDESVQHLNRSTHANAYTAKAAFRIARRCPANEVRVIARINRKTRKWPNGREKEWVIDRRNGRG